VGKLPSETAKADESHQPTEGKWGLVLQDVTPRLAHELGLKGDHGIVVAGVQPGSPADLGGIRKGDIILEVNRQPANSVNDVMGVIAKADNEDTLLLLVKRDRGSVFIALEKKA
jgi:serine protease Do